jgi:hypothetical protein
MQTYDDRDEVPYRRTSATPSQFGNSTMSNRCSRWSSRNARARHQLSPSIGRSGRAEESSALVACARERVHPSGPHVAACRSARDTRVRAARARAPQSVCKCRCPRMAGGSDTRPRRNRSSRPRVQSSSARFSGCEGNSSISAKCRASAALKFARVYQANRERIPWSAWRENSREHDRPLARIRRSGAARSVPRAPPRCARSRCDAA